MSGRSRGENRRYLMQSWYLKKSPGLSFFNERRNSHGQ
ncbi:MAG: hypothetical protein OJF50_005739 [Nitrospira sp.]|nr:hypothetical protein [Nitrospira sp.]